MFVHFLSNFDSHKNLFPKKKVINYAQDVLNKIVLMKNCREQAACVQIHLFFVSLLFSLRLDVRLFSLNYCSMKGKKLAKQIFHQKQEKTPQKIKEIFRRETFELGN